METIINGKSNITKLLGKQQVKDTKYRLMNYVLQTACEDGILLHNSITGQLVLLNGEEASILELLPGKCTDAMIELIENHFLVPENYDEKDVVKKLRYLIKRFEPAKEIESYTILTTTNCNARCFYCYESDLPHLNMDETTANKLVDFMLKHKGNAMLKLHWFGGEPLVCVNRIDQICEALKAKDVRFVSSMTSNGYLFTEEMTERAAKVWNLDSIQITLDGTEEIYNRTKSYVNVTDSPYRRVLKNIQLLLARGIRVIIRLNLDKHNAEDLKVLISELDETIENREKIEVYSHVLFEDAGFAPIERDEESRAMLYSRQIELNLELAAKGLGRKHQTLPFLKTHNCMADTNRATVVYPDGKLFKCEHVAMEDEYASIYTDIVNEGGIAKFQITTEYEMCATCPVFPSCILLLNCQGLPDKNIYTCNYEINCTKEALSDRYHDYKTKGKTQHDMVH